MEKLDIKTTLDSLVTSIMRLQDTINKGVDRMLDTHPSFTHHAEQLISRARAGIRNILK